MNRVFALVAVLPALALGVLLGGSATAQDVSNCPDPPPPSQTSETINYTGAIQQVAIPPWASNVEVTSVGGWGQSVTNRTGSGGAGGQVTGTLDIDDDPALTCLDVWVGGYGQTGSAFGWGNGGGAGINPFEGNNGGGGGGATAIAPSETPSKPVIIAGGGGGGGGNGVGWQDWSDGTPGAAGGAGAGGDSNGFGGMNGGQPAFGPNDSRYDGKVFGVAGQGDGPNGGTGFNLVHEIPGCPAEIGAGGGGGGGRTGGSAGFEQDPMVVVKHNPYCLNAEYGFGAGGGAGGDSWAASSVSGASAVPDDGPCADGSGAPGCFGSVTIDWSLDIGTFEAIGGSGQSAVIGGTFAGPLQAQVLAVNGEPIPGLDVTFTLPSSGASATFEDNSSGSTSVTVASDQSGTATTPPLIANGTAGSYEVEAALVGLNKDATFSLSNTPATTATALWATPSNPSVAGEQVTFVANVRAAPSTAPPPAGDIQFAVNGSPLGAPVPLVAGEAIAPPIAFEPGFQQATATFQPTPDFLPSGATSQQQVDQADTHIDLSSSENPSADGTAVTFTADVMASAPGAGIPTGQVTFEVDGGQIGQPVDLVDGSAVSAPDDIPDGSHTVEATYSGDQDFMPSTVDMQQTVGPDATATEIAAAPAVAVVGQTVTVTTTVKPAGNDPGTPTGSVTIQVDGITACDELTLAAGQASCEITASPLPGPHSLTATYEPGSGDFDPSSGSLTQTVVKSRSAVTVEADPDPSTFGQSAGFHAQVAPIAPGGGEPSGAVSFLVDGSPFGNPVPLREGRADSGQVVNLPAGPHALVARYGGDASFRENQAGSTQVVDRALTTGTLTPSSQNAPEGTPIRFELELGAAGVGSAPTGTARMFVDGDPHGPPVSVADGTASFGPVAFTAGSHQVRVQYAGNGNFSPIDTFMTATATRLPPPFGPDVTPGAPGRNPLLCGRQIAIDDLTYRGKRLLITGTAKDYLIGLKVGIRSRGRLLARAKVRADATFTARVRAPGKRARRTATYVAVSGSARSAPVRAIQRLRFTSSHRHGRREVRLRAGLNGGKVARIVLKRKGRCGEVARTVHRVRIRGGKKGRRTLVVTVPRPAQSEGPAAYWLKAAGKPLRSLPVLVMPEPRRLTP